MIRIPLTHKGWFGPVPIYSAGTYAGRPLFVERHWLFAPLMIITHAIFTLALISIAVARPNEEQRIPLTITGRIEPGRSLELPVAEG